MDKLKSFFNKKLQKLLKAKLMKYKLIVLIVIVIIVILLASFVYFITLDDGTYKEGDISNTVYVAEIYKKDVRFTENGIKFFYKNEETGQEEEKTSKEMAEMMWDSMWKLGSNIEHYLDKYEELEKLINAELITQYPKITNKEVDLNGTIEFERHKTDGTSCMLQYVNPETFNNYLQNKDTNIINYFTVDENCNVLIGIIDETTQTLTSNDPEMNLSDYTDTLSNENVNETGGYSKTEYNITTKNINYKSVVSKYTMPFQYLWSLIVVGQDKGVGLELADLVEKSQIVISIYDNVTTTVNTTRYTYNKEMKVDLSATATAGSYRKSNSWQPASEWTDDENYQIELVNTYKNNLPVVDMTKADVWIIDYSKEYTYQSSEQTDQEINERDIDPLEYIPDSENPKNSESGTDLPYYDKFKDKLNGLVRDLESQVRNSGGSGNTSNIKSNTTNSSSTSVSAPSAKITQCSANYYKHEVNKHETNEFTQFTQKYVAGTPVNNPKVKKKTKEEIKNGTGQDNFVTILCDPNHYAARKQLTFEVSSWLFEILEKNPDTVNMIEMTKFLFNKVLGRDEFETNFTFDEFANNNFYSAANIFGNNCEEKVWFALIAEGYSEYAVAGLMGNLMQESGFKSNNLQGTYEKKLGMTDETYTNGVNSGTYTNFVHDSAGYGLAQWTYWSRKEALLAFSRDMGTGIDDEDMQINFLIKEIKERGCPQWQSATNVNDACYYFEKEFEQAGNPQMGNRLTYANDIYYRYRGKTAPTTVDVKLTGENKKKMEALLQEAQRIANDNRYTYSQPNRYGEFQYDCSSFVCRLYAQFFGITVPSSTGVYGTQYRVGSSTSVELQPGDVLWRAGHVTLYIGNGIYAAAHGKSFPINDQISVYSDNPAKYTYVYRFITN